MKRAHRNGTATDGRHGNAAPGDGTRTPGIPSVPCIVVVRRILFCACGCSDLVHEGASNRGACAVHPACPAFRPAAAAAQEAA